MTNHESKLGLKLYSYRRCPFAMRVRFTLNEKGIHFEVIEEDLGRFSADLKRLHPQAKVPVLVHGDWVLYESAIITEYIEEMFPGRISLMPSDPKLRSAIRLWTYWCNHILKPDLDRLKYGKSRFQEQECEGVELRVKGHLDPLEKTLLNSPYISPAGFSLADIHLFPFFRQLSKITPAPPFLNEYPNILSWMEKISRRPAFVKTMER